jgi:hypothetical protein
MSLTPLGLHVRRSAAPAVGRDDEREQRLAEERRVIERERAEFDASRKEWREQQWVERQRATAAEVIAADLGHDVDADRPGYVAGLIHAAAAKGRGEGPAEPVSGVAAEIVRQGKVRRGEEVADLALPDDPTAKATVLSGRRRRGEAVSADDQVWLDDYMKRAERQNEGR